MKKDREAKKDRKRKGEWRGRRDGKGRAREGREELQRPRAIYAPIL